VTRRYRSELGILVTAVILKGAKSGYKTSTVLMWTSGKTNCIFEMGKSRDSMLGNPALDGAVSYLNDKTAKGEQDQIFRRQGVLSLKDNHERQRKTTIADLLEEHYC